MTRIIFKDWLSQPTPQTTLLVLMLKTHLKRENLSTIDELLAHKGRKSIPFDELEAQGFPRKLLKPTPMHLRKMHLVDSYRKSAIHLTDNGIKVLMANSQHWSI